MTKSSPKVVIAGGGLVGAMNACFFALKGWEVEVYEARRGSFLVILLLIDLLCLFQLVYKFIKHLKISEPWLMFPAGALIWLCRGGEWLPWRPLG
jgi:hypothetical protein